MAYTGGPLNELNGKMGISAPYKSVAVMKLIKAHQPRSKDALVQLISDHAKNICACGVKSCGSVESFGKNLYEAQIPYWNEYRYSLSECVQWEYDLFVVQSLKGGIIEKRAITALNEQSKVYQFEAALGFVDEELRIDIMVKKEEKEIAGIQVKPLTYQWMRKEVITFNTDANRKWGKPVFYLYYDADENFANLEEVLNSMD